MGRPKGSKNKNLVTLDLTDLKGLIREVLLESRPAVATPDMTPTPLLINEKANVIPDEPVPTKNTVTMFVNPMVALNGIQYSGWCEVPMGAENDVKEIMRRYVEVRDQATQDRPHKTINLGEV